MTSIKLYGFSHEERTGCGCCHNETYHSSLYSSKDDLLEALAHFPSSKYYTSWYEIDAYVEGKLILIDDSSFTGCGFYYRMDEGESLDSLCINFSESTLSAIAECGSSIKD